MVSNNNLTPIPEYPLGGKGVESALRSSLLFGNRQYQGDTIKGEEVCVRLRGSRF